MSQKRLRLLAALVLLAGIGIMLYPLISNMLYQQRQKQLADYYQQMVSELPQDMYAQHRSDCQAYNESLINGNVILTDPFDDSQLDPTSHPYVDLLNLQGDGAMGSLEIPKIGVNLMIYHGTSESVLQKGVGHLEGTSLPVGGSGTHVSLSAHTGLPGKELFTNLDQLELGDVFYLHTLDDVLAYEVDQICVVLPYETEELMIHSNQDYVTLITCTPYGVNSHRLLVRGTRVPYEQARDHETSQTVPAMSTWQQEYLRAIGLGVLIVSALGAAWLTAGAIQRRRYAPKRLAKPAKRRKPRGGKRLQ